MTTLQIELPDNQTASLNAKAAARGLTLSALLGKLAEEATEPTARKPPRSGRGKFAKYGPAPTAEEIDANRQEMFRDFPQEE